MLFVISQYFCERSKNVWTCRLHWCIIIYVIKIIVRHFVNKSILLSLLLEKSIINFIYKIRFYNTWKQIQIIKNFSCLTIFFYKYRRIIISIYIIYKDIIYLMMKQIQKILDFSCLTPFLFLCEIKNEKGM